MGQQEQPLLRGTGAEIYERGLVPAIFAPWAAILIEQAALQSYVRPDGLAFPMQAHLVTAQK